MPYGLLSAMMSAVQGSSGQMKRLMAEFEASMETANERGELLGEAAKVIPVCVCACFRIVELLSHLSEIDCMMQNARRSMNRQVLLVFVLKCICAFLDNGSHC